MSISFYDAIDKLETLNKTDKIILTPSVLIWYSPQGWSYFVRSSEINITLDNFALKACVKKWKRNIKHDNLAKL